MIEETADLRRSGDLTVWTLCTDRTDRDGAYEKVRKFMRDTGLNRRTGIPVLWYGPDDEACGELEWYTPAVPTGVLINPEGTVVFSRGGGISLDTIEYLMQSPGFRAPVLSSQWELNDDRSMDVTVQAYSPDRTPVTAAVKTMMQVWMVYDRETREADWQMDGVKDPDKDYNACGFQPWDFGIPESITIEVDDFGYGIAEFTIPGVEGFYSGANYRLNLMIPGTEHLNDGYGLVVSTRGTAHYPRDEEEE